MGLPLQGDTMVKKQIRTSDQVTGLLNEIQAQTDRGAAIIAVGMLDELLELVILARLVDISQERRKDLFDTNAPLHSFSAKIEMAFALGVIVDQSRVALHLVRVIRNAL